MTYHILNGDSLASQLITAGITDNSITCRECLIEGPLAPMDTDGFWNSRNAYICETYGETPEGYNQKVKSEFEDIKALPADTEINLWFEDDLFCQANLWFILHLLKQKSHTGNIYRIFPVIAEGQNHWGGFGWSENPALNQALKQRVLFSAEDMELGVALWQAYSTNDLTVLTTLAQTPTLAFAHLQEVIQAHLERFPANGQLGRPQRVVQELIDEGHPNFKKVFLAFFDREGIYGFGDLQVKRFFDEVKGL